MLPLFVLLLRIPFLSSAAAGGVQEDVESILERLRSGDASERLRALEDLRAAGAGMVPAAIRALEGGQVGLREKVGALLKRLSSESWKDRHGAARALVRLGRAARPMLEAASESSDPEVSWRVRDILAELGEGEGLEEDREGAQTAALCTLLGEAGDGRAIRTLLGLLASGRPEVRLASAEALGRLRDRMGPQEAAEAAEGVLEIFGGVRHPPGAAEKARLLRVLGDLQSPAGVRPLEALLADRGERDVHVKRMAVAALAAIGDAASLRVVVKALGSEEVYVRQAAAVRLREVAGEDFGIDPMDPAEAGGKAVLRARAWWSGRFGEPWGE